MERKKIKIYIAGPYTYGFPGRNVTHALSIADKILDLGFYPYVPHLTHFWDMIYPRTYESWMELDLIFLEICHGLFHIEGASRGVEIEIKRAKELYMPIFRSIDRLKSYEW
jgi:Domain of unknown function (DUF4406)